MMRRLSASVALLFAMLTGICGAAPNAEVFDGQLLVLQDRYLVLSTGDALHVGAAARFEGATPKPGMFVRITIDPLTKDVVLVIVAAHPFAGGRSVSEIPREAVAVDPRSARKPGSLTQGDSAQIVQVTIVVEVPANTPTGDAVYFSSDRSNFSAGETRMDQVDALHWSLVLPLVEGAALHYKFTRGSFASTERDRAGADIPSRSLVARKDLKTSDVVLRWADLR